jgi:site-specific DNA-methyltransferase (adenine-specific)
MSVATGPGWELRLGDCIEGMRTLADDSVDVTISDPPFEAEAHTKGKRQGKTSGNGKEERGKVFRRVVDESFDFAPITDKQRQEAGYEFGRVTRCAVAVFCQVEAVTLWRAALEAGGLVYRRTIPWVKPDAMPSLHGRWPGQAMECIVLAIKPGETVPVGGKARYYSATRSRGDARAHDTAKPLSLMLDMVEDFSRPGDLVLDAFAGSATTGVACAMGRRQFLGWELAPCAKCNRTATAECLWFVRGELRRAFLCDVHGAEASQHDGFRSIAGNMFDIACRRLRGDEAKPNPAQPSLFDSLRQNP